MIERLDGGPEQCGEHSGRQRTSPDDAFARMLQMTPGGEREAPTSRVTSQGRRMGVELDVPMLLTATGHLAFAAGGATSDTRDLSRLRTESAEPHATAQGTGARCASPSDGNACTPRVLQRGVDSRGLAAVPANERARLRHEAPEAVEHASRLPEQLDGNLYRQTSMDRQMHMVPSESGVAVYVRDYRASSPSLRAMARDLARVLQRASMPLIRLIINGDRVAGKE